MVVAHEPLTHLISDEVLRKALWLKIAVFAIEDGKTIKPAIEIMKESECLKIEDILPHFPDFVVIDDFKEDICAALEECRPALHSHARHCCVALADVLTPLQVQSAH